jgi:polysaccharide biosynthesis transport protein
MRSKSDDLSTAGSLESLERAAFQQYWLILKRRWKPSALVFIATVVLSGIAASLQKPSYTAGGKLVLKPNRVPSLTGLGGESAGRISNLTLQSNPLRTEAETILSEPLMERTIAALDLKDKKGKSVKPKDLMQQVKVKDVAGADVLRLTYDDPDPKRAAAVINQLMKEYLSADIQVNRSESVAAREFIVQQLPKSEAIVQQADAALRDFKERSGIPDLDTAQKALSAAISDIEGQITRTRTELAATSSRFNSLQQKLQMDSQQAIDTSLLSQSPGVQQTLAQLQQVQNQLELERSRYTDEHPTVVNLSGKVDSLKGLLSSRVAATLGRQDPVAEGNLYIGDLKQGLIKDFVNTEVERLSLNNRLSALANARAAYVQQVGVFPELEQQQRELQRRLDAAQSTYSTLLKRLQEVQLTERQNIGNARIIESASIPDTASGSKSVMLVVLGVLAGSALALATVIFLEIRDGSIKTIKEARDLFGYTWLGTIPFFGKLVNPRSRKWEWSLPELPVRDAPRSLVSAAYRMLQANLKFISLDEKVKSLVITSSVPKEGKSTVAANLAATMAQLGRKTLLIDADLHRPSQHHIWDLTNMDGLSNFVVGQCEFTDVVESVMDNLDVLTAGVIPPNPLGLLDSKRMAALVQYCSSKYECVIIDAPPLVVEAEALTLGKIADGVLLVVRPGVVDFESATTAKELLKQSAQNVLGMVVNSAILESDMSRNPYYNREISYREPAPARAL